MSPTALQKTRELEDEHWWFCARNEMVMRWLSDLFPAKGRILDAGCGSGGLLQRLQRWQAKGIDVDEAALEHCRRRGLSEVIQGDVARMPWPADSFDAVLCLDVLYHRDVDPLRCLAECWRVLAPGGLLLMNLAAHEALAGSHDQQVCGARRYNLDMVRRQLAGFNFRVVVMHHWNVLLAPWIWLWRRLGLHHCCGGSDLWMPPAWLNAWLRFWMRGELALARDMRPRLGSSLFVLAMKVDEQGGRQ